MLCIDVSLREADVMRTYRDHHNKEHFNKGREMTRQGMNSKNNSDKVSSEPQCSGFCSVTLESLVLGLLIMLSALLWSPAPIRETASNGSTEHSLGSLTASHCGFQSLNRVYQVPRAS